MSKGSRKTVEEYVQSLGPDQRRVVSTLIELVRKSAPQAKLSIKWAQPVFEQNGPFCYVRSFKDHVNFGFWRGMEIASGRGILVSGGSKMGHVKIASEKDIRREVFEQLVREAVRLNETKGDPTKSK